MNIIELTKIIWFMVLAGLGILMLYAMLETLCERIFGYVKVSKKNMEKLRIISDKIAKEMEEAKANIETEEKEDDSNNE